jgi:hypothetical protein
MPLQQVTEGEALDVLHHDEDARIMRDAIVDGYDVGVVETRDGQRLGEQPVEGGVEFLVDAALGDLEGDLPAEADLAGQIDIAHGPTAKVVDDLVPRRWIDQVDRHPDASRSDSGPAGQERDRALNCSSRRRSSWRREFSSSGKVDSRSVVLRRCESWRMRSNVGLGSTMDS